MHLLIDVSVNIPVVEFDFRAPEILTTMPRNEPLARCQHLGLRLVLGGRSRQASDSPFLKTKYSIL